MPIYEYKCLSCGHHFEVFVRSHKDARPNQCPKCKSNRMEKRFSTPSIIATGGNISSGTTCCGSTERCQEPPCSQQNSCARKEK